MKREEKCLLAIKLGFKYNKETGDVISPTGKAVCKKINGYLSMCLRDENKIAHYLYCHQFAYYISFNLTVNCIDHINQNKIDNRIENLRSVTKSQNAMNIKNVKGYSYCNREKKYIAMIMVNYKTKQLGSFDSAIEARNCYLQNKSIYHKI